MKKQLLNLLLCLLLPGLVSVSHAQVDPAPGQSPDLPSNQQPPARVDVTNAVSDTAISERLTEILTATTWFDGVTVRANAGVIVLEGITDEHTHREWAERLASNTEGVVAVVNQIRLNDGPVWDLTPAWNQIAAVRDASIRHSPMLILAMVILLLTVLVAKLAGRGARALLARRVSSLLLQDVAARILVIPVFLLGLYFVLSISGLTRLAVTVIGSTGLIGLVLGFAFRDIAENFLASVLISMNRPFAMGDRIEVAGHEGFVQSVNTRSTLLMSLEGNHVQIPNATIYKSTIKNYTANPKSRFDFTVGIGYDDEIINAQCVALDILKQHPAVLADPEPLVLVDSLGAATVVLRVYFWIDISRFSSLKVLSAVIRQTKAAFEAKGISMPDEAREIVFPKGVPVQIQEAPTKAAKAKTVDSHELKDIDVSRGLSDPEATGSKLRAPTDVPTVEAEGGYTSEAGEIERQARESRAPEGGENLLKPAKGKTSA